MFDVVIIGNGPAGVSAALYTKRANLNTLVIGKDNGALEKAERIDNYYGFPGGISGIELIKSGLKQLKDLGVDYLQEEVITIEYDNGIFSVGTNKGKYITRTVILATGVSRITTKLEGIKEFEGKGVSYCAVCDGFFFKDKDVAVLGSGDYAINEVQELLPLAKSVSILTNGKERVNLRDNRIKVYDNKIKRLSGNDRLEKVEFVDNFAIDISGVFVAEGKATSVDFARRIGAIIDGNNIVVDSNFMTNIDGLFAAGDAIGGLLQISKAVSDGAKAGISVINYVRDRKNK